MSEIESAFNAFCAFGSARGKSNTDLSAINSMDNQRFAKFCKDCGIVKGDVTTTDVDIIFNKVKQKTSRRIDFTEFSSALGLLAEIRYKKIDKSEAKQKLISDILKSGGAPKLEPGTTSVVNNDITKRLTDHTQYGGTHKNRFDTDGKGLGKDGRDKPEPKDLSQITNRKPADARGVQLSK
jgi:hypothetical protein